MILSYAKKVAELSGGSEYANLTSSKVRVPQ